MSKAEPRRAAPSLFGISLADVLKLVIASAVVGVLLRVFNVNPRTLWADIFDGIGELMSNFPAAMANIVEGLGPAFSYVLYGAAVVVPIFVVARLFGFFFGKR